MEADAIGFFDFFKEVPDHRIERRKLHSVSEILLSRIRKGNAPRNMAIIKKTALNLLNFVKKASPRLSLKRMRKMAGWDNTFLDKILTAEF